MTEIELKEKIVAWSLLNYNDDHSDAVDALIALIAPELEKARLWTMVKEMANHYDMDGCQECPLNSLGRAICNYVCVEAKKLVDALEGDKP